MTYQLTWRLLGLAGLMMLWPLFGAAQVNLDSGLVIYYPFDGNTADSSGNNIHGNLLGATPSEDRMGRLDRAIAFDGIDDYLETDSSEMVDTMLAPISVSAWVKIDALGQSDFIPLISKSVSSALHFRYLLLRTSELVIAPYPFCNGYSHRGVNKLGEWFFFSAVQDTDSVFLFLDGLPVDTFFCSNSLQPNQHPLRLGLDAHGVAEYFQGSMDEFRLYNRRLTPEEVLELRDFTITSAKSVLKGANVALFPNPAPGAFTLTSPTAAIQSLALYDLTGRHLPAEISHDRHEAQVRSSYRGLVLVKVQTDQGLWVQKVIFE